MGRVRYFIVGLVAAMDIASGAAQEPGAQPLPAMGGCGAALPAYFLNPQDVQGMFGAEAGAMTQLASTRYGEDVARACGDSKIRDQFRQRVRSICFAAAAGVDEPHPYIVGDWLVIEFHPDEYDRPRFRRALARAIARGSVGPMSYECEPATGKATP